ncbi:MAG: hypothetical protein WA532_07455 [Candidatus Korobacteraceae bacterium]
MHLATKKEATPGAVPLEGAVLCVNCECVSSGRFDECPVCGSRQLLNIGQMLGGEPLSEEPTPPTGDGVLFDLTISIELKQMNSKDVNAAVDRISRLIGPRLGHGRAGLHINVEPVSAARIADEPKAA